MLIYEIRKSKLGVPALKSIKAPRGPPNSILFSVPDCCVCNVYIPLELDESTLKLPFTSRV